MFEIGDWVIETNKHRSCDIVAIIPAGPCAIMTLYIVQFSDNSYEIFDESSLTAYNKYYWDSLEDTDG